MAISTAKAQAVSNSLTQIMRNEIRNSAPLWPMIATRVNSQTETENYAWLNDVPQMKEFLGDRIFEELRASTYTLTNKTYEQSVGLDRHKIDDDNYGFYTPVAQRVARKAARHPDVLLVELLNAAESTVCYDGQFFYDTDHVEGDSGTQSNDLTSTVVSTSAVTAEEFRTAFHAALIQMMGFKTDQGDYLIEPSPAGFVNGEFKVLVPLELFEVAHEAMSINLGSGGGDFHRLAIAEVIPLPRMSSSVKFDLVYTGDVLRPFIFQDRAALSFQTKGADDIETKLIKVMTEARYQVGFGLWQYAVRTTFTT